MTIEKEHIESISPFDSFDDKVDFGDKEQHDIDPSTIGFQSPRKALIARAAGTVKSALNQKLDLYNDYKKGSLVFDEEKNKFGRIIESKPGYINLAFISGGEHVLKDEEQLDFVRKNRTKLTLPEIARQLFLSELEVIGLLNQIELENEASQAAKKPTIKKASSGKATKTPTKKPELKVVLSKESKAKPAKKPEIKIAAKKSGTKTTQKKLTTFSRLLPKGATTDPVVDPNGYIQQNFLLMSNKELAVATGLSEHTVRRKLGEWSLRRKDFTNKVKN